MNENQSKYDYDNYDFFFLGGGGENPLKHLSHYCLTAYFQLMLAYNKLNMIALLFYYTDTPHVCSGRRPAHHNFALRFIRAVKDMDIIHNRFSALSCLNQNLCCSVLFQLCVTQMCLSASTGVNMT